MPMSSSGTIYSFFNTGAVVGTCASVYVCTPDAERKIAGPIITFVVLAVAVGNFIKMLLNSDATMIEKMFTFLAAIFGLLHLIAECIEHERLLMIARAGGATCLSIWNMALIERVARSRQAAEADIQNNAAPTRASSNSELFESTNEQPTRISCV